MLWTLLLACGSEPTRQVSSTIPQAPGVPGAPAPVGGLPGGAPAEDLAGSWDAVLAAAVPPVSDAATCPDADGDGATDAWSCPLTGTDCDDTNPAVTAETERWVRPGPFLMGSSSSHAGRDEGPVHVVSLSGYCLDRRERVGTDGALVAGVDWATAKAMCEAEGKTLPTEAQWEKAARGGCERGDDASRCDARDLRPYPWGFEAPTCARANHQESTGFPHMCEGAPSVAVRNTGPYGHDDLAGNLWEWTLDRYHPQVYRRAPLRVDPLGPAGGDLHVLRGGGWNTFSTNMRVANRLSSNLEGTVTGVRCARVRAQGTYDEVAPLEVVRLSGEVRGGDGPLVGAALYVTAFDAADADPVTGALAPGRSPVAETRLAPGGADRVTFQLEVPEGGTYVLMGALDAGAAATPQEAGRWVAQSGSGGFGSAEQNPVHPGDDGATGIVITIHAPHGLPPGAPASGAGPANRGGVVPPPPPAR